MKRLFLLAALVAASAFAPASAQGPADRTQAVSYADLDLSRASDVRTLDRRIRAAVAEVCGTASSADPKGRNEVRRCRTLTRESLAGVRAMAIASAAPPTQVAQASERQGK